VVIGDPQTHGPALHHPVEDSTAFGGAPRDEQGDHCNGSNEAIADGNQAAYAAVADQVTGSGAGIHATHFQNGFGTS